MASSVDVPEASSVDVPDDDGWDYSRLDLSDDELRCLEEEEESRIVARGILIRQEMILRCKVPMGCWCRHSKHLCTKCGNDDSDHTERNCPQ